jgi:hypothetical protein
MSIRHVGHAALFATLCSTVACTWGVSSFTAARTPLVSRDGAWGGAVVEEHREGNWLVTTKHPGTGDGATRFFLSGVSAHTGLRKGWVGSGRIDTQPASDLDITELHGDLSFGYGWGQIGVSYLWSWHRSSVDYTGTGPELRASFAPIGPLSLDVGYAFLHGENKYEDMVTPDTTARRLALGGTFMAFGIGSVRMGLKVDYHRLSGLDVPIGGVDREYTDSGVTGELIVTWF